MKRDDSGVASQVTTQVTTRSSRDGATVDATGALSAAKGQTRERPPKGPADGAPLAGDSPIRLPGKLSWLGNMF